MKNISLLATLLIPITIITHAASATDRLVPSQYPTIQAAITAAIAGDVVQVAPGSYVGPIDTGGKAITVRGTGVAEQTVISGGGSVLRCVSGETSGTVFEFLTFTGGTDPTGAGVRIDGSSPVVRHCRISGNNVAPSNGTSARGAGVYIRGGQPEISDCLIAANSITVVAANGSGAGVYLEASHARISRCNITGNFIRGYYVPWSGPSGNGGGACAVAGDTSTFDGCTFATNALYIAQTPDNNGCCCYGHGTAIYFDGPSIMVRCTISQNANYGCGGALAAVEFATNQVSVSGSTFCGNSGTNVAGVYIDLGGNRLLGVCTSCAGDLNNDGVVNGGDLGLLLSAWGSCPN